MTIKTWQRRCEEHPDHDGIVSDGMIQARMQEEIDELRTAIEQAKEPVAWISHSQNLLSWDKFYDDMTPLYTAPRQWQGLTRREFLDTTQGLEDLEDCWMAIEAALRSKNA